MSKIITAIGSQTFDSGASKNKVVDTIQSLGESNDYTVVERNDEKPWGAYLRLSNNDADKFVSEFFPGLSSTEARLGNDTAELSPKFLIVSPRHRLSWQHHDRRAERWAFLTEGGYHKSTTDDQGDLQTASAGDIVQFGKGERHRLVGAQHGYTIVAEIWQHIDDSMPSDENDITRLADDYQR